MGRNQDKHKMSRLLIASILYCTFGTQVVFGDTADLSSGTSYFLYQQSEYPRDCKEVLGSCSSTNNISGVHMIKPDGYPEPFEVYCDNDMDNGGWTVLQRRQTGSIGFNRQWKDFKTGFGFLGSEFWIGNEKIAYLTNQKQYQLRLDITSAAGQTYYVTYDQFRISDEWGEYSLSSLTNFEGTDASRFEWCPNNKIFSNETCETTCNDPETCISSPPTAGGEKCVCVGEYKIRGGTCIRQNQCGCFDSEKRAVIANGHSYVNIDCTRRSNCSNDQLNVEEDYRCSDDATCDERNGERRCYCNNGYEGDGVNCVRNRWKDCHELQLSGTNSDGVYTIYPDAYPDGIQVFCQMESNGGGWTVIQKRSSASVDFYRTWNEYSNGFENPRGDHWLGNDYIHALTTQKNYSLRIDLTDSRGSSYYAVYGSFSISNAADKYRLSISSYSGNAGYDSMSWHNNKQFSTRDEDNDGSSSYDCAEGHRGAWWFDYYYYCNSCSGEYYCDYFQHGSRGRVCGYSHLNGDYDGSTRGTNIFWSSLSGYDCGLQYTDMKIKPS